MTVDRNISIKNKTYREPPSSKSYFFYSPSLFSLSVVYKYNITFLYVNLQLFIANLDKIPTDDPLHDRSDVRLVQPHGT